MDPATMSPHLSSSIDSITIAVNGKMIKLRHLIDDMQKYSYYPSAAFSINAFSTRFAPQMVAITEHFSLFHHANVTLETVIKDILLNFNTNISVETLSNLFTASVDKNKSLPPIGNKIEVVVTPNSSPKGDISPIHPSLDTNLMSGLPTAPFDNPKRSDLVEYPRRSVLTPLVQHGPALPSVDNNIFPIDGSEIKRGSDVWVPESKCDWCIHQQAVVSVMSKKIIRKMGYYNDYDKTSINKCKCHKKRKRKSEEKPMSIPKEPRTLDIKKHKYFDSHKSPRKSEFNHSFHSITSSKSRNTDQGRRSIKFRIEAPTEFDKLLHSQDMRSLMKSRTSNKSDRKHTSADTKSDRNHTSADTKSDRNHTSPDTKSDRNHNSADTKKLESKKPEFSEEAVTDISNHIYKTLVRNSGKKLNPLLKAPTTSTKPMVSSRTKPMVSSRESTERNRAKRLLLHALPTHVTPKMSPETRQESDSTSEGKLSVMKPEVDGSHLVGADTTALLRLRYGRSSIAEETVVGDLTSIVIRIHGFEFEGSASNKVEALQKASYKALLMAPYLLVKQDN